MLMIIMWLLTVTIKSETISANKRTIEPKELCQTDDDCRDTGIQGNVTCIKNICICNVDSTFITKYGGIKVCSKNLYLGAKCNLDIDCAAEGSMCIEELFGCPIHKYKTCQCLENYELRNNKCEKVIERKPEHRCCFPDDCPPKFECDFRTNNTYGLCKCKDIYFKNECFSRDDLCNSPERCGDEKFCEKFNDYFGICKYGVCKDNNCFYNNIIKCEKWHILHKNQCYNMSMLNLEEIKGYLSTQKPKPIINNCPINFSDQVNFSNITKCISNDQIIYKSKCYNLADLNLEDNMNNLIQKHQEDNGGSMINNNQICNSNSEYRIVVFILICHFL